MNLNVSQRTPDTGQILFLNRESLGFMSCKLYRWVGLALHLCINIKQVHGVGVGVGGLVSTHKLSFIHPYIYSGTSKTRYKKLFTHVESHASAVSLPEGTENSAI